MQSDTRIFVFRLRQLLTFLLVLIILIAAAVFILFVIGSSKKDVQTSPASAYTAGVYTSSITLNNQSVDIQVVVDKDHIKSASIVNLDESVAAMYPLLTTSMDAISAQLAAAGGIRPWHQRLRHSHQQQNRQQHKSNHFQCPSGKLFSIRYMHFTDSSFTKLFLRIRHIAHFCFRRCLELLPIMHLDLEVSIQWVHHAISAAISSKQYNGTKYPCINGPPEHHRP